MTDTSGQSTTPLVFGIDAQGAHIAPPGFEQKIDTVISSLRVVYEKLQAGIGGPNGPQFSEISFSLTLSAEGNAFGMAKIGAEGNVTVTFRK